MKLAHVAFGVIGAMIGKKLYEMYQEKKAAPAVKVDPLQAAKAAMEKAEKIQRFDRLYSSIKEVLPYNESWPNSTGYFNGAAEQVKLPPGAKACSYDAGSCRKLIFVGTDTGTFVFFERYTRADSEPFELRAHIPDGGKKYLKDTGDIELEGLEQVLNLKF